MFASELERFDLRPPQSEAQFEPFFAQLWRFLRAGVLALLTDDVTRYPILPIFINGAAHPLPAPRKPKAEAQP